MANQCISRRTRIQEAFNVSEALLDLVVLSQEVNARQSVIGLIVVHKVVVPSPIGDQKFLPVENRSAPRSLGHDWYVNLFPSVRPKAILQVSDPQIGVEN